jgi:hypothetical protein
VSHARITAVTSMIKNGTGNVPGLLAVLALVPVTTVTGNYPQAAR